MGILGDGFSTIIDLTGAGVTFKEKSVQPPGLDGGDAVENSTMRNTTWRTFSPRKLVTATEASIVVAYDPAIYDSIVASLNVNQQITITFPDGSKLAFWGFLKDFQPGELAEGSQPEATITIVPTNQNSAGEETGPDFTAAAS